MSPSGSSHKAAVPEYVGQKFDEAPPGHRFRLYFDGFEAGEDGWGVAKDGKAEALKRVASFPRHVLEARDALVARQAKHARNLEGRVIVLHARSTAPFVTGMGNEHPTENGFAFADPHGLPVLPGSGVKGVIRRAAEELVLLEGNSQGWDLDALWALFGFDATSSYFDPHADPWGEAFAKACGERKLGDVPCLATWAKRYGQDARNLMETLLRDLAGGKAKPVRRQVHFAGALRFWDVYPDPAGGRMAVSIMNPHYPDYYQGKKPPVDNQDPNPIPFLALPAESGFLFQVHCEPVAGIGVPDGWQDLLRAAFDHAFDWLGFGAKTALGYGGMRHAERQATLRSKTTQPTYGCDLELATPAYLGGADQKDKNDCDLTAGTLRGQLRWWWRTMHASHLSFLDLLRLESMVWGNTKKSSPVRVVMEPLTEINPLGSDFKKLTHSNGKPKLPMNDSFFESHGISGDAPNGLKYLAYGMDEISKRERKQRHYLQDGTSWRVSLSVRARRGDEKATVSGHDLLQQAKAALWLLCRYGGVGSRSRKGFGSLLDVSIEGIRSLSDCRELAASFRDAAGLSGSTGKGAPDSTSIDHIVSEVEVATTWKDPWFALAQLGTVVQDFASKNKHKEWKEALGLPRQIHGPRKDPLKLGKGVNRHASPVLYHISQDRQGNCTVRGIAFLAPTLPDEKTSRQVLGDLLDHVQTSLAKRAKDEKQGGGRQRQSRPRAVQPKNEKSAVSARRREPEVPEVLVQLRAIKPSNLTGQIDPLMKKVDKSLSVEQKRIFAGEALEKLSSKQRKRAEKGEKDWFVKLLKWAGKG